MKNILFIIMTNKLYSIKSNIGKYILWAVNWTVFNSLSAEKGIAMTDFVFSFSVEIRISTSYCSCASHKQYTTFACGQYGSVLT